MCWRLRGSPKEMRPIVPTILMRYADKAHIGFVLDLACHGRPWLLPVSSETTRYSANAIPTTGGSLKVHNLTTLPLRVEKRSPIYQRGGGRLREPGYELHRCGNPANHA